MLWMKQLVLLEASSIKPRANFHPLSFFQKKNPRQPYPQKEIQLSQPRGRATRPKQGVPETRKKQEKGKGERQRNPLESAQTRALSITVWTGLASLMDRAMQIGCHDRLCKLALFVGRRACSCAALSQYSMPHFGVVRFAGVRRVGSAEGTVCSGERTTRYNCEQADQRPGRPGL